MASKTATIEIEGMHCASCVRRIERGLLAVDGVSNAAVNLATNRASVAYDAPASPAQLAAAVEKSGYAVKAPEQEQADLAPKRTYDLLLIRFVTAAVLSIPVVYWSMIARTSQFPILWLMAILSGVAVFGCGAPFFVSAWRSLRSGGAATMDTLIALGSSAAYFYSLYQIISGDRMGVYFDTAAMIVTFILLGRWLESQARARAGDAVSALASLVPKMARLVESDGSEREVAVGDLRVGDKVRARPGEKFAVDGVVVEGSTAADESLVTGESVPISKGAGDNVVGGAINLNGSVVYRTSAVGADTALARIARLVEQAQSSKAPVERLADLISAVFVPVVLSIAAVTFLGWLIAHTGSSVALMHAVAVLVIACPCALGLATPTAIMVSTGRGAKLGILFRDSGAIEMLARVQKVVFDKTGTLTEGRMRLTDVIRYDGYDEREIISIAASAERGSEHALGAAIVAEADRAGIEVWPAESFAAMSGEGVQARVGELDVLVGAPKYFEREGVASSGRVDDDLVRVQDEGKTAILVAVDRKEIAMLAVADNLRSEATAAVSGIRQLGIDVSMLSGDSSRVAGVIAKTLGISEVVAGVKPDQKLEAIEQWQRNGSVRVAMVGDGVNDAAALAQADVGIAMAGATDIASHAASLTLLNTNLEGVPKSIMLARRTMGIIKQNLFWAFLFNAIGIPLAAFGRLNPMIAAFAMAMSSVIVVGNSLRLRSVRVERPGAVIKPA